MIINGPFYFTCNNRLIVLVFFLSGLFFCKYQKFCGAKGTIYYLSNHYTFIEIKGNNSIMKTNFQTKTWLGWPRKCNLSFKHVYILSFKHVLTCLSESDLRDNEIRFHDWIVPFASQWWRNGLRDNELFPLLHKTLDICKKYPG
jgi:hypothetical protein